MPNKASVAQPWVGKEKSDCVVLGTQESVVHRRVGDGSLAPKQIQGASQAVPQVMWRPGFGGLDVERSSSGSQEEWILRTLLFLSIPEEQWATDEISSPSCLKCRIQDSDSLLMNCSSLDLQRCFHSITAKLSWKCPPILKTNIHWKRAKYNWVSKKNDSLRPQYIPTCHHQG